MEAIGSSFRGKNNDIAAKTVIRKAVVLGLQLSKIGMLQAVLTLCITIMNAGLVGWLFYSLQGQEDENVDD